VLDELGRRAAPRREVLACKQPTLAVTEGEEEARVRARALRPLRVCHIMLDLLCAVTGRA